MRNGLKIENQYIIQFTGLKEGVHHFDFILSGLFFEEFDQLEVPDGNVTVHVVLDKGSSFMDLDVALSGTLRVQCDRCLDYFGMDVSYTGHLVVKFGVPEEEGDGEILFLSPEDHQIDLKHYLYECVSLSIPYRKVHPDRQNGESGCDPGMLEKLKNHLVD